MSRRQLNDRLSERGSSLVFVILLGTLLMGLTVVSVELSRNHTVAYVTAEADATARSIVESALARAIADYRDAGITEPKSGNGANASWSRFGDGDCFYETSLSSDGQIANITAWARVPMTTSPAANTVSPDSPMWDGSGWLVRGLEVSIESTKHIPDSPIYFGKGGIQEPIGGFAWSGSSDLDDPDSWDIVTAGNEDSYQTSDVPFRISALDHPSDFLANGGTPEAAQFPHPYPIIVSANPIAQLNVQAWFDNSADTGTPTSGVSPSLNSGHYNIIDASSDDYPYPIDTTIPKAQTLAWSLWQKHRADPAANNLSGGVHSGTYGTLGSPEVTIVTGGLEIDTGEAFRGAGVLVIRDDYDPNVDTDNTPDTRAWLRVRGTFEWTGMVIITGWNPHIYTYDGSSSTIVGALLGEDSVQSMGEPSLDSSSFIMQIEAPFHVYYARGMFVEDGEIHSMLPTVERTIVGIRSL